jgi:thioesterase domain-containing protein
MRAMRRAVVGAIVLCFVAAALFVADHVVRTLHALDAVERESTGEREDADHHEASPASVEREIAAHGFQTVTRDDRFIDRAGEPDVWWLIVFRKP